MKNTIDDPIEDFKKNAQEGCASAVEYTDQALKKGKCIVSSNPVPFVLGAFGLGLILAWLLPKAERSHRERYLEDPLDELKEILRSASQQVNRSAGEARDNTSSAVENALTKATSALRALFKQ